MREKQPAVYILANKKNGTIYTGVTSNLIQRTWQHKTDAVEGFTKKYKLHSLVWFEIHESMESAISKEKQVKSWKRGWKINAIEKENPDWVDLYSSILSS